MKTWSRGTVLALLVLACSAARADDPPIPGLVMDAVSKSVIDAWRAKTARPATRYAQAPVLVKHARLTNRPPLVEGVYRFDLVEGEITWSNPGRGRMLEPAWWRFQLDWILREPGLLFYLAHSTLTGETSAQGTTVRVSGRSSMKVLRFDARGDLVGLSTRQTAPGGRVQDAEVRLEHARFGKYLLLAGYVMEVTSPDGQGMKETGRIGWALVRGKPMPREILMGIEQLGQKLDLVVKVTPWKLEGEAYSDMDLSSSRALQAWESREYNLGRLGIARAQCEVALELEPGAAVVRGTYAWDGEKGSVTWQDAKSHLNVDPPWHVSLDHVFRRYWLREDIGTRNLTASKEGGKTVVRVVDPFSVAGSTGYQSLTFTSDGALARISRVLSDGVVGVLEPTWYRVVYPKNHVFEGMLQYEVPASWKGTWKDINGTVFTRTRTFRYVAQEGLHVPSRLEIRTEEAGVRTTVRVLTFRSWKLTRVPLSLKRGS